MFFARSLALKYFVLALCFVCLLFSRFLITGRFTLALSSILHFLSLGYLCWLKRGRGITHSIYFVLLTYLAIVCLRTHKGCCVSAKLIQIFAIYFAATTSYHTLFVILCFFIYIIYLFVIVYSLSFHVIFVCFSI